MQLLPSIMPSVDSFGASAENKAFRIKSLLSKTSLGPDNYWYLDGFCSFTVRIDNYVLSLHSVCEKLMSAVVMLEQDQSRNKSSVEGVVSAMQAVTERVQQLTAHCNVILLNDGLRDLHAAQADRAEMAPGDVEVNAVSLVGCVMAVGYVMAVGCESGGLCDGCEWGVGCVMCGEVV